MQAEARVADRNTCVAPFSKTSLCVTIKASMYSAGSRQEALNVYMAALLSRRGLVALPEQRLPHALPDVLVSFRGLRLIIEGEVDDQPGAEARAWQKAVERVDKGLAHLALALVYPHALRHTLPDETLRALENATLRFSVCTAPASDSPHWCEGTVDLLHATLENAYSLLASEDEVRAAVELLTSGINTLANALFGLGVSDERLAIPLGISPSAVDPNRVEQKTAVRQIAALVIVNALLFQEELVRSEPRVKTLHECMESLSPHDELLGVWKLILDYINYHAVFDLARRLLQTLPPDRSLDDALRRCAHIVREIARRRVLLRHDLAGRVYHLLLGSIAKPLGTYYTSVAAATLLLRVALEPERWEDVRWQDPQAVGKLRVADLACGTGTLLMAAIQAVTDNFLRTASLQGEQRLIESRRQLLREMLEKGLWGFDVLQSAVHLTATTLALPAPEVMVKGMHLYTMELGMRDGEARLGSLDLMHDAPAQVALSLFPTEAQRVTDTDAEAQGVRVPKMHLICMNPPFTRTCGDNLLFGSVGAGERSRLQKALQERIRRYGLQVSVTAGLGSVFVALADRYLKPGGRLAFVLPKALLSGVEWQPSRQLLGKEYALETVIVSHDPERWNFSENTDLSEVLFVARKASRPPPDARTLYVNLWRNPDNPIDALMTAEAIREASHAIAQGEVSVHPLWVGNEKMGEVVSVPWAKLRSRDHWMTPCAFAQGELVQTLWSLLEAHQWQGASVPLWQGASVPLCELGQLGELGPDIRRLWATFDVVDLPPGAPAVWGHDSEKAFTMLQQPNSYLVRRAVPREKQTPDYYKTLLAQAGNLIVVERMRLNTQRLTAAWLPEAVLAASWWPVRLRDGLDDAAGKALVLWFNSTLSVMLLVANRVETMGAWTKFKKPTLSAMPVLDVRALTASQRAQLAQAFDRLCEEPLLPLPQMAQDATRIAIDEALCQALGLPDLSALRAALAREPVVCLHPLRQRRR